MIPASVLHACTAVTLRAKDGSAVLARTQEWGAFDLDSEITVVSRQTSFTGTTPGKRPGGLFALSVIELPGARFMAARRNDSVSWCQDGNI